MQPSRPSRASLLLGLLGIATLPALVAAAQGRVGARPLALTLEQREILAHMSLVYLDDGQGGLAKTIRITGANVQLVNGLGATNGNPTLPLSIDGLETETNGLGNLIVGYAEPPKGSFDRTGSHSIVLGVTGSHSSFGGIVSGAGNRLEAPHASAIGGSGNQASGDYSVILSGALNEARGAHSAMLGGDFNLGSGDFATVLGGSRSLAFGRSATATGGYKSFALGDGSSVSGGSLNRAEGAFSTISGGANRVVTNLHDWAAGSLFEED
jgi:hypothetical protein